MKILVFSDSHGNVNHMRSVIKSHLDAGGIDRVFFLGDGIRDVITLAKIFPSIHFDCVLGNCDSPRDVSAGLTDTSYERLVTVCNRKFLLMHGHKYDVKYSYYDAVDHAIELGADCLLFGHTHKAEDIILEGTSGKEMRLINPGSCGMGFHPSFALLELVCGELVCGFGSFN